MSLSLWLRANSNWHPETKFSNNFFLSVCMKYEKSLEPRAKSTPPSHLCEWFDIEIIICCDRLVIPKFQRKSLIFIWQNSNLNIFFLFCSIFFILLFWKFTTKKNKFNFLWTHWHFHNGVFFCWWSLCFLFWWNLATKTDDE